MKISSEIAKSLAYRYEDKDRYIHVAEEFQCQSRWGIIWRTVYIDKLDGKYYAFAWETGATESQDYDEFDEVSEFDVERVEPVEVTVTEYHKV